MRVIQTIREYNMEGKLIKETIIELERNETPMPEIIGPLYVEPYPKPNIFGWEVTC